MSETVVIVLWFREAEAAAFEDAFTREVRPLWDEFRATGKFLQASLARIGDGNQEVAGAKGYLLVVETPSRDEHNALRQGSTVPALPQKSPEMAAGRALGDARRHPAPRLDLRSWMPE